MSNNLTNLKPCPFCTGKAEYWYNSSDDSNGQENHQVNCMNGICGASIEFCGSKANAYKTWNRRDIPVANLSSEYSDKK